MTTGTVKFFNVAKGFGFITADEGGKDIFAPAASLAATGLSLLKTGQRVSFEAMPDTKGPKAVNITVLADAPPPVPPVPPVAKPQPPAPAAEPARRMAFYHDPASAESCTALDRLRAAGFDPRVVEYLTTPPAIAELKSLSLLLRNSDQSLVRKYDPLFRELCLDDRFISETEFWGAIVEHPTLINGPIVATEAKAGVCRSKKDVENFLAAISPGWVEPAAKQKSLPEGILRLMMGEAASPRVEKAPAPVAMNPAVTPAAKLEAVKAAPAKAPSATIIKLVPRVRPAPAALPQKPPAQASMKAPEKAPVKAPAKTSVKTSAKAPVKAQAKPQPKAQAKPKPKSPAPAKTKKPAAKKPVKKTARGKK